MSTCRNAEIAHISASSVLTVTSELVMLSLDLVKTRLSVMSMEMRKNFIQVILTSLIEKSPDPKILRAVVKIVEEWVKNNSPMAANQVGKPHPQTRKQPLVLRLNILRTNKVNTRFSRSSNYFSHNGKGWREGCPRTESAVYIIKGVKPWTNNKQSIFSTSSQVKISIIPKQLSLVFIFR